MEISRIRINLRKGSTGTFRALKPGELIEAGDVIVNDCYYDFPSEQHVGSPCDKSDTIIRLEFEKEGK